MHESHEPRLPQQLSIARYYRGARTVHLERLATFRKGDFLYYKSMYDFDTRLAASLPEVSQVGFGTVLWRILRKKYDVLELAEPYTPSALPQNLLISIALLVSKLTPGEQTKIVTYAIENADLAAKLSTSTRVLLTLMKPLVRTLVGFCYKRLDRIAFGTAAARDNYLQLLGRKTFEAERPIRTLIWGLPSADPMLPTQPRDRRVIFLGSLDGRKGITQLMDAWLLVTELVPGASLTILGKGPLERSVQDWANPIESVDVLIDPTRGEIREQLAQSSVLFLLSQPSPMWKEQIGLPLLEGLSLGLEIVSSTETGISDWLHENGHQVIDPHSDRASIARALESAIVNCRPRETIAAALPDEDGRLQADRWIHPPTV